MSQLAALGAVAAQCVSAGKYVNAHMVLSISLHIYVSLRIHEMFSFQGIYVCV